MLIHILLSVASAQEVTGGALPEGLNAQAYRPAMDATGTLWTNDTLRAPSGSSAARATFHYAMDPAVYLRGDGQRTELVSSVWQLDVVASHTRGPFRLGVDVPVILRANGDLTGGETGLGDMVVDLRWSALDRRQAPFGVGFSGRVLLPTATIDAPLSSGFGWEVEGLVDAELGERWVVAANVGTRSAPEVQLENMTINDQLYVRGGVSYGLGANAGLSFDVGAAATYGEWTTAKAVPVEAIVGGYTRVADNWVVRAGVGSAVTQGIGAPTLRVITGVAYQPRETVVEVLPEPTPEPEPEPVVVVVEEPEPEPIPEPAVEPEPEPEPVKPAQGEKIELSGHIFFETNQAVIKQESHAVLDEVAEVMIAHPDIRLVRIEGHTDDRGAADFNRRLSQQRADAVMAYLVEAGVEPERLVAEGYGEDHPVVTEGDPEYVWEQNRRVDFVVVEVGQP